MLSIRNSAIFLLLPVFVLAGSVSAHHSHSNYEIIEFTHLQGKVTELFLDKSSYLDFFRSFGCRGRVDDMGARRR